MEPKDLKNSEEFKRPLSDESELNIKANASAISSDNDVVDNDIVAEAIPEKEDEASGIEPEMETSQESSARVEETESVDEAVPEVPEVVNTESADESLEIVDEVSSIPEEESDAEPEHPANDTVVSASDDDSKTNESVSVEVPDKIEKKSDDIIDSHTEDVIVTDLVTEESQEEPLPSGTEPEAVAEESQEEPLPSGTEPEAVAEESQEEPLPSGTEPEAVAEESQEELLPSGTAQVAVGTDESELPQTVEELSERVVSQKDVSSEESEHKEDDAEYDESEEADQIDYNQLSQIELVNTLRELVESGEIRDRTLNLIIVAFNLKVKENIAESKKQFVDQGGNEDDFVAEEDPYENDIKELVKKHRQTKFEQAKRMEVEKEINLQKKYTIIEDIKNLLNTEESINRTFQEFRDLQRQWYELGPVPQAKMKDLWDTYHFHVENFYDYIKINKELRDLDLKKNLEMKISLCDKAEELLVEPSVIRAFNTLQKFHEQWREIGPVPRDKKDDIWERFKAVTTAINQKHQEFFEKRKVEQKRNLDAKIALCEKVEEIWSIPMETHREWDEKSKQLIELQKVWRTIGFAPKRDNNKIYDRFRNACDQFFNKKRDFYSQNKELQNKNMQMKIDLCMEAEALKESDDWKKTTQQFIDIQKRWKDIGPVPRKHSDILWKRFRAACDYFFDRKSLHFSDIDEEQFENLNLKKALIEEVEKFEPDNDVNLSLKALREFQRRWTEIGHVPIRDKDAIQNHFRAAINTHFDSLKLDNSKRDSLNFRSKIATMTENQRGLSKVRQEREKYMAKLKQLETDLTLLDNNIGFFANSKNAQALIADVNQKIADTREKIEMLKDKIRIIDDLDKTEY